MRKGWQSWWSARRTWFVAWSQNFGTLVLGTSISCTKLSHVWGLQESLTWSSTIHMGMMLQYMRTLNIPIAILKPMVLRFLRTWCGKLEHQPNYKLGDLLVTSRCHSFTHPEAPGYDGQPMTYLLLMNHFTVNFRRPPYEPIDPAMIESSFDTQSGV